MINKNNLKDVIINSIKGFTFLTSNINNLPFQINWNKNRIFKYENINIKIKLFINCIQKQNKSWKDTFISNMNTIQL